MNRSIPVRAAVALSVAFLGLSLVGCLGKESIFAGRAYPPSTIQWRVLAAIQNSTTASNQGQLQILDARYDIRNAENGLIPSFFISAYGGGTPTVILNYPEQETGYVYGYGDGSINTINYATETKAGTVSGAVPKLPPGAVYVTQDGKYAFVANQPAQYLTVVDNVAGITVNLNLPNVYKVAVNPSGSVALALVQNSNYAYRIIHLQQPNGTFTPPPTYASSGSWAALGVSPVDCQPVNTPYYCVVPVLDQKGNPIQFDRPFNAIYSSDGTTAWLLNCGPECGNLLPDVYLNAAEASVSFLNAGVLDVYNFPGSTYPTPPQNPPPPTETYRVPVPGGATMALYGNGNLYISGQQLQQSDKLLEGFLSILNLSAVPPITSPKYPIVPSITLPTYPIADGTHTKMLFGDDNTLWIGSQICQVGERTANPGLGTNGCLTLFNMNNSSVLVEPWYGDLTGLCSITGWHKMYTAYGGQIHIYATTSSGITTWTTTPYQAGTELDNYNVTVTGTAYDVAYMDALSNAAD